METKITHGATASLGKELMRQIQNNGGVKKAPVKYVEEIKAKIIENSEELIEVGARVRPLLLAGKSVGWVRGIHSQERRMLKRWIQDPNDYILNIILLATTFSKEEIEIMTSDEIRNLTKVIQQMSDYDMSLYPYLSAYVSTQSSENLWYGKGEMLTSYENKSITMPDGKIIKIMAPPNHSRVWASLCSYREQAKKRLEQDFNALFIVRPWAGKHADPIANDLKRAAKLLETDSVEPWEQIVHFKSSIDKNDGWGHLGDSVEELRRELKGMLEGDKHETVMEAWGKQIQIEAEQKKIEAASRRIQKGITEVGITESPMRVITEAEVQARQKVLREGKAANLGKREEYENSEDHLAKIMRYS